MLAAFVVFGTASAFAGTITITQASSGITSGSYSTAEVAWTQSTVGFGAKAVMKQSGQAALQFQASNGVIYNTGALPGNITSIAVTQTGTARACTVYGGTARLVNSTTANYTVTGGTSMGTTSGTPSTVNFSGSYTFFAIKVPSSATYITQIVITYADGPTITERHEVRVEQLPAEGTVMVMDAVGRTIATRTLTGADNMTFELPVDGVYTITVMTPARNYTLKTVIR